MCLAFVERAVAHRAKKISLDRTRGIERGPLLPETYEGDLHHIVRRVARTDDRAGEMRERLDVPLDQRGERPRISEAHTHDELVLRAILTVRLVRHVRSGIRVAH